MYNPTKSQKPLDFRTTLVYNLLMGYKSEVNIVSPRTGRPTDNPKGKPMHVRLDKESDEILEQYCKQENISKTEATRRGIKKLKSDLKSEQK